MNVLLQRSWHITGRLEDKELICDATYCGTDRELVARLTVETQSLQVLKASWEVYRAPGLDIPQLMEVSALEGLEAYLGCGGKFREALSFLNNPLAVGLFSEAVRGVIQSSTFLYKDRGFQTSGEYENNWTDKFAGSCRYYSNLDRVSKDWYEHIGYDERSGNLFNRTKTQIFSRDNDCYVLTGHLIDSFHGVAVELLVNEDGLLKEGTRGIILRAPDKVCKEASCYLGDLVGNDLASLSKKDIASLLGNGQGCMHLIDLVTDGAETYRLFLNEMEN